MVLTFSLILLERQTLAQKREVAVLDRVEVGERVTESTEIVLTQTGEIQDVTTNNSVLTVNFMREGLVAEKINKRLQVTKQIEAERNLVSTADYERVIRQKCAIYGCNSQQVIRIMYCESSGNKYAQNVRYFGLFQHDQHQWAFRTARYGVPGASIFDPYAQIQVTTRMFAEGQSAAWECK